MRAFLNGVRRLCLLVLVTSVFCLPRMSLQIK